MSISIKEYKKKIQKEDRILKKNQKTINKNNKEIQLLIEDAKIDLDPTQLKPIILWLEQMIDWEQQSMNIRTINAYAQFHSGRISGMNLAIDLLNTIIKNKNKKS
jgi:hypothetical protein